jgi:hypothetical protein
METTKSRCDRFLDGLVHDWTPLNKEQVSGLLEIATTFDGDYVCRKMGVELSVCADNECRYTFRDVKADGSREIAMHFRYVSIVISIIPSK